MKALFLKEIRSYLGSIIGYTAMAVFLISSGFFVWIFPGSNNIIDMGESSLQTFFSQAPGILMFLFPAFTMRCFAEEKKTGTLEILMTQPISIFQIIFSKFLAASFLAIITILPTLIYYISVYQMGEIVGNIDHPTTVGGYLGLILLSITFVAIGVFASSLSKNQVIAFLLGLFFNFFIYLGISYIAVFVGNPLDYYLIKLSMLDHFNALHRGIIDSRDLIYFISLIFLALFLTKTVLKPN
ncbi:MAG: ABC transporter permease subunit [Flavobacteriales bacterium]|jgi:ABC-2 type transport system permease protein|nr:ABC transporter permease subunit [Flavobacteriales bacterium]MDG1439727.1 ABC transporter permease subunit [Flavobacteriales bacterium]MDG1797358.1 ABC transporter permease subunit [Flavobacteriales bacterium]